MGNPNLVEALTTIIDLGFTESDVDKVIPDKSELDGKFAAEIVKYCIEILPGLFI